MKYDKPNEKKEVIHAFEVFLKMRGWKKIKWFCSDFELDYQSTYRKIYEQHIDHDYIVSLIKLIDKNFSLFIVFAKFQILKEQR